MNVTSTVCIRNIRIPDHDLQNESRHDFLKRTNRSSPQVVSAGVGETYGFMWNRGGGRLLKSLAVGGIYVFLTFYSQVAQAELTRPIDLRIEIDKSLNSSPLCQKLVRLHEDRNFAPWGNIFSKPSHFCPFPLELSKGYSLVMWRLAVTEAPEHISFVLCRPTRAADVLSEDCAWRLDLKKTRDLVARLQDDQVLFSIIAALHEKLPLRAFDPQGENYSRPEPRLKSPILEIPPRLVRGVVRIEEPSGRLLVTPMSFFQAPPTDTALWFVPAEPMQLRQSAMAEILRKAGLELTEPPPPKAPAPVSKSTPAKPIQQPILAPKKHTPLKVVELPPTMLPSKSVAGGKARGNKDNQTSVFAIELAPPPDDREVIQLDGATEAAKRSAELEKVPLLTRLWNVLWPGLWKASIDVSGLPVPESERSRLPSTQGFALRGWHPVWRWIAVGGELKHVQEKEHLDLKISLPGNALYQQARGQRKTTLITGSLLAELNSPTTSTRIESRGGLVFLSEDWAYDRTKSTFEIWMPARRGTYFEPSISVQPLSHLDGFSGRAAWGIYRFSNAEGQQWNVEAGWQWAFDPTWFSWDEVRIPSLQTFIGLQQGSVKNTGTTSAVNNVNSLPVNSFVLGLRLNVDETY